jgi:N-acetylneuraminic acid mutarotase
MRRGWAVCLALVLLASCTKQTASQGPDKEAFVRQLIGYCAEVDRQVENVPQAVQPGTWADQLARFASQARAQTPPAADREKLNALLADIESAVQQFQAAQTALGHGDQAALKAAISQATQQLASANTAALNYGMPPLADCPKHMSSSPSTAAPTPAPPKKNGWQAVAPSLVAVQQTGAAVLKDGRIWVPGGLTGPLQTTTKVQFYDPTTNAWDSGPPLPYAVHHAMVVAYRDQLVVIGGFVSQGTDALAETSNRMQILQNGHWMDGPRLHHPRGAGAAAVVGNKIIVVGGRTGDGKQLVTQTEIYDGTSWQDAADIPVHGDHLAAASDGTYLYAVGGRNIVASTNTGALQRYDPNTNQWIELKRMPLALSGVGAAVIGRQLIVVGGESATSAFATVQAYDLTTSTWTSNLPNLTQARHGLAVAVIGTTLYAIDGATQPGHTATTPTVEALTFS